VKKIIRSRWGISLILAVLIGINFAVSGLIWRIDLTAEKRYTLSEATAQMLMNLEEPVVVTVLLKGEFPAGFKKLANSTEDLLRSFKFYGKRNLRFNFVEPGAELNEEEKQVYFDSLASLGIAPLNVQAQAKKGEGAEQRLVYPYAVVSYKDRVQVIDLLEGLNKNEGIETLNSAEALLEYKLASCLDKITREKVPVVGYAVGNGQTIGLDIKSLSDALLESYYTDTVPLYSVPSVPEAIDVLLIIKPKKSFSEAEKFKIDQFLMRGGKVVMALDVLNAEFDSLQRAQADFIAFDRGLNLQDQLFKYGVRINPDLLQDLQSDRVPMVIGSMGGAPQMQLIPFPYFVLLNGTSHPITKNLDRVLTYFPSSIDTVAAEGVQKSFILTSSVNARTLQTPALVSLNSVRSESDLQSFNKMYLPAGVLLEGQFSSFFQNRMGKRALDSLKASGESFLSSSRKGAQLAVFSDGDIFLNQVGREGPLTLGKNLFTEYQYANKVLLTNLLEYMVGNPKIVATRAKDFNLRLLDQKKMEQNGFQWQILNIALPAGLMLLIIALFQWYRKRKYGK
jgi:ABC-2 type transport system permease protein